MTETLPYYGYCYYSGPYKGCWIKYGYDPIMDPNSRLYQMIQCRVHEDEIKRLHTR